MTAKKDMRWLLMLLLLSVLAAVLSCDSSSTDVTPDPNAARPSITGLNRGAANIGDTVEVYGLNFNDNQQGASVRLNNVDFAITDWTETKLEVVVTPGMVSGIVVVTVAGTPSQSGPEAQLFIPAAPGGAPLIGAVSPDYGEPDAVILITGSNFGNDAAAGNVFFAAQSLAGGVSQAGGVVAGEIVTLDVDGTQISQWGHSAIKVKVPWTATTGDLYVEVNGDQSNKKLFTWIPPGELGPPEIDLLDPSEGPVGTAVVITGENFGHNQGGSLLKIGTLNLIVSSWTNTEINAIIPVGATTNPVTVTVGPNRSNEKMFTVGNIPVITGVSPSEVRVGQSFSVYGHNFGFEQGTGTLLVGGTAQPVTNWNNDMIHVDKLIAMSETGDQLAVMMRSDSGLESNTFYVSRISDLIVKMTVDPRAGQRHNDTGEGGTEFTFRVTATGGSGNYDYFLIPDAGAPTATVSSELNEIPYTYPYSASADDEMDIDTQVRVEDKVTGDTRTVDGPTVLVVNHGVPVITKIEVAEFNRGVINAPNDWCYLNTDGSYHDFSYLGADQFFTSSLSDILVLGSPLPFTTRDLEAFLTGYATSRPYGYRYSGANGSMVVVRGLNFGASEGELWLRVNVDGEAEQVTGIGSWEDTAVTFAIPPVNKHLTGTVRIITAGTAKVAESTMPLIASAYATQVLPTPPNELNKDTGTVTVLGFDFQPQQVTDMTGPGIFAIWTVRAQYPNPWGAGDVTGLGLVIEPVPAATIAATTLTFEMADLDPDLNGFVEIEVYNGTGTESQVVEGELVDGDYFFFLWTGAIVGGAPAIAANSGIFGEAYMVTCGGGGTGDDPPDAALVCTPTSRASPLDVHFDASASTDDGTITKYEFRSDAGEAWVDQGLTSTWDFQYVGDDTYMAEVRVTDDAATPQTDTQTVQITVGGGGPGDNEIRIHAGYTNPDYPGFFGGAWIVRLYGEEFPDPVGDPPQMPPVPPIPIDQKSPTYTVPMEGTIATATFEDVPDGTNYWVLIYKGDLVDWDPATPGDQLWVKIGPISVPPDYDSIDIMGIQVNPAMPMP